MGSMASEKEMNQKIKSIVRDSIFPKAPFAADSDFDVDGKIFKVCAKAYKNGGGIKEHFKNYWQKNGGCLEGRKGSPKTARGTARKTVFASITKSVSKVCFLH
jgi:hypothetical protein